MLRPAVPATAYRRALLITGGTSLVLTIGFLLLPLAGTDLSAQVFRGHFVKAYGFAPVDFRWYGGIFPAGYSLISAPLMAVLGARGVGAAASVVGALAFVLLLLRTRVPRPVLGGVLGAVCLVLNLVSGRTTYALGVACGLLALLALTLDQRRALRLPVVAAFAVLAGAASPVAGLFTGLAAVALLIGGRHRDGVVLGVGAALPLVVMAALFNDGGIMPFTGTSYKIAIAESAAVFFLVPPRYRAVRAGAVLAAVGILLAYLVPTPVGANSVRIVVLFAIPVVAATARLRRAVLALALILMVWWAPPFVGSDLQNAGNVTASRAYYQPLIDQLQHYQPVGRVEVVPLADHWESTYVADAVPIARGWERQVDVNRNPLFYDDKLTPTSYRGWLYDNAVSYVAVPDQGIDQWGTAEAALVDASLPYLQQVWEGRHWRLFRVVGSPPLVSYPARLVASGATGVSMQADAAGSILVRVRWSRWLTLTGPAGCVAPDGYWTRVQAASAGAYRLSSALQLQQSRHC